MSVILTEEYNMPCEKSNGTTEFLAPLTKCCIIDVVTKEFDSIYFSKPTLTVTEHWTIHPQYLILRYYSRTRLYKSAYFCYLFQGFFVIPSLFATPE